MENMTYHQKKVTIMSPLMGADFDVTNWSPTEHQSWSNTGQTLNQTEVQYGPFLFSVVGHHWRGLSRWDSGPPWTRNCLAVWLTIPWRVERSHIPNHFHESSKRIQGEPWVLKILIMMARFFSPWDPEIPSQTSSNDLGIPDFLTSWLVNMNLEKVTQDRESRGIYHASIILVQVLNDVSVGLLGPETVARWHEWFVLLLRSCLGLFLGHPRNTWNPLKRALAWEWLSMWFNQWQVHTMAGSRCLSSFRDAIPILVYSTDQEIFMLCPLGSTVLRIDFPTWQLPSSRWMLIRPFLPLWSCE